MVIGESEILGQVRRAHQAAADEGMVQRVLGGAFRQALRVGKRARTETEIGRNPVSVSSAAVDLARRAFPSGSLDGKKVVIVGAGKMGRLAARSLASAGARDLTVVNRTDSRGEDLAALFDGEARSLDDIDEAILEADILICSTTAPEPVLHRDQIAGAMAGRSDRALFIVDIAVPRDVDPTSADVPGVVLRDIDDLKGVVETNLGSRMGEISKIEEIISGAVDRFVQWERSTEFAPTAAALVAKADVIRRAEMERIAAVLGELTEEQRNAIDHLSRRMVSKILHTPLDRVKKMSSSKQGYVHLAALRELFELDDENPE